MSTLDQQPTGLTPGDVVDFIAALGPDALIPRAECEAIGRGYRIQDVRDTAHGPAIVLVGGGGVWLASAFIRRAPTRQIEPVGGLP